MWPSRRAVPRAIWDKRLFLPSGTASHFWTLSQFGLQATGRASIGKVLSLPSLPANQIIPTRAELGLVVFCKSCSSCPAFTDILPFYACFLVWRRHCKHISLPSGFIKYVINYLIKYLSIFDTYQIPNDATTKAVGFPHLAAHLLSQCHVFWFCYSPPGPYFCVLIKIQAKLLQQRDHKNTVA